MSIPKAAGTRTSPLTYALLAGISGLFGFGGVYASLRSADRNKPSISASELQSPVAPAAGLASNPMARGDMLTFVFRKMPEPISAFTFEDSAGATKTLSDWKGKVVLLNVWATWCAPCRREMPALDHLQRELGGKDFEVVALSVDRQGLAASKKFLDETKVTNLNLYVESTSKSIGLLHASGLPTSILIDRNGLEVGRLAGPAEWDSEDAKALIRSVLNKS